MSIAHIITRGIGPDAAIKGIITAGILGGSGGDTTPDQFSIPGQSGVARSTVITSAGFIPVGYDTATVVTANSGATASINGGAYSTAPGNASPGDTITARITSSGSYSTAVTGNVVVGGVSAAFTVITESDPAATGILHGGRIRSRLRVR